MKLKNNILSICAVALAGLTLGSCGDVLEIKPLDTIVEDNFWNEESDVENIVAGCYSKLQSSACVSRMIIWGEARSENLDGGSRITDNTDLNNIFNENITATNGYTTWVDFYDVINRCNIVLQKAPEVAAIDPNYTESELLATEAEMIALRSLCYFYLIRTFRDVPYNTEAYTDDNQEMALPATSFDVILDSLINDLEEVQDNAVKTYPETNPEYQHGRITQDAIHAMLCEMYLWKEDYSNSIRYADMVINSKLEEYEENHSSGGMSSSNTELINGFPLISCSYGTTSNTYGNAFDQIFVDGDSDESIFELIYTKDNDNMLCNYAVHDLYGNAYTPEGLMVASELVSNERDMTTATFNIWLNKYDARSRESMYFATSTASYVAKFATSSLTPWTQSSSESTNNLSFTWYTRYHCQGNWIIYRLTDIMLLKAEAMAQLLPDSAATEAEMRPIFNIVNAVNKRSYCSTSMTDTLQYRSYATKDALVDLVYDERERELIFEGKRWYDLVRRSRRDGNTDYLLQAIQEKGTVQTSVLQSSFQKLDRMYWPYNYDELTVNTNLVQNSSFSSGVDSSHQTTN